MKRSGKTRPKKAEAALRVLPQKKENNFPSSSSTFSSNNKKEKSGVGRANKNGSIFYFVFFLAVITSEIVIVREYFRTKHNSLEAEERNQPPKPIVGTFNGVPITYNNGRKKGRQRNHANLDDDDDDDDDDDSYISSKVHCIGEHEDYYDAATTASTTTTIDDQNENSNNDLRWMFRSCKFEYLCFDYAKKDFLLYPSKEEVQLYNDIQSKQKSRYYQKHYQRKFVSVSSSMIAAYNNSNGSGGVALGSINPLWYNSNHDSNLNRNKDNNDYKQLKWFPHIDVAAKTTSAEATATNSRQSNIANGFYELPSNVVLVPFHSYTTIDGSSSSSHSSSTTTTNNDPSSLELLHHILFDDLLPIFTLLKSFHLIDKKKQPLLVRYDLNLPSSTCGSNDTTNQQQCNDIYNKYFIPIFTAATTTMGERGNKKNHEQQQEKHSSSSSYSLHSEPSSSSSSTPILTTTKDFQLQFTSSEDHAQPKSNLICSRYAVAGIGMISDRGYNLKQNNQNYQHQQNQQQQQHSGDFATKQGSNNKDFFNTHNVAFGAIVHDFRNYVLHNLAKIRLHSSIEETSSSSFRMMKEASIVSTNSNNNNGNSSPPSFNITILIPPYDGNNNDENSYNKILSITTKQITLFLSSFFTTITSPNNNKQQALKFNTNIQFVHKKDDKNDNNESFFRDQISHISKHSNILITMGHYGAMMSTFLQRGSSLIMVHLKDNSEHRSPYERERQKNENRKDGTIGTNDENKLHQTTLLPIESVRDLADNVAYHRTKWVEILPLSSLSSHKLNTNTNTYQRIDFQLLLNIINEELQYLIFLNDD